MSIDKLATCSVMPIVNERLKQNILSNYRDNTHFHPSEWHYCQRKIAYGFYEAKGYITLDSSAIKVDTVLQRIFDNGHYMHDRYRDYMSGEPMLRGRWRCMNWANHNSHPQIYGKDNKLGIPRPEKCECGSTKFAYVEVGFHNEEVMIGGHVDAILDLRLRSVDPFPKDTPDDESCVIIDFKSMNDWQFKQLMEPLGAHNTQMQIYLFLSEMKVGRFVYECKDNQRTKEFPVFRDEKFIEKTRKDALQLKYIVTHLTSEDKRALPLRLYEGRTKQHTAKTDYECTRCKFRGHCWGN